MQLYNEVTLRYKQFVAFLMNIKILIATLDYVWNVVTILYTPFLYKSGLNICLEVLDLGANRICNMTYPRII